MIHKGGCFMKLKETIIDRVLQTLALIRNQSLQNKIIIVAILPAIISMVIQSIVSFKSSAYLMYNETLLTNDRMMDDLNEKIYQYLRNLEMNLVSIYNYENEMSFLESLSEGRSNEKEFLANLAQKLFLDKFDYNENILGIYIYLSNRELVSSYKPIHRYYFTDIISEAKGIKSDSILQYMSAPDSQVFIDSYFNEKLNKNILRLGVKINQIFKNKSLGIMLVDIDDSNLAKIFNRYHIYRNQAIWLQHSNHTIIYSTDSSLYKNHTANPLAKISNSNDMGKRYKISVVKKVPKYELDLVNYFSMQSIQENLGHTTNTLVLTVIFLSVIVLVLSYFLSITVTAPVKTLMDTMEKVEKGNISVRANLKSNDEIGKLANSFNSMLAKIDDLIIREYKATFLKNEAELKALQAQINPHFLYNTLQVMGSIARSQKINKISDMCAALSDMFRYSINMKGNLATIYEEITHVKNYLYIQNIRFNKEFNVRVCCNIDLYEYAVPRLILQPLVENSIEHGLMSKAGKKLIKIQIYAREDKIYILVIDNGIGLEEGKLKNIKFLLSNKDSTTLGMNGSIGILNVNNRMRILFGNEFGLNIYSKRGKGTLVKMKLPIQSKDNISNSKS